MWGKCAEAFLVMIILFLPVRSLADNGGGNDWGGYGNVGSNGNGNGHQGNTGDNGTGNGNGSSGHTGSESNGNGHTSHGNGNGYGHSGGNGGNGGASGGGVPLDGGLSLMLAAGAGYGAKKIASARKASQNKQ